MSLSDQAFSISSSLGRSTEIAGRSYGHVIDPRDGRALSRGRQALVVAPTAGLADALSTALVVLEVGEALELIEGLRGSEALLVDEAGPVRASSGWQTATDFQRLD